MRIISLFFLFILTSCSTSTMLSKVENKSDDILNKESLLRYSSDRLQKLGKASFNQKDLRTKALTDCHDKKTKKGLYFLKKESLKYDQNFLLWNAVGTCYYLRGNQIKAEFYFKHSISLTNKSKKKNPTANNNLGLIALSNRNFYLARSYFLLAQKEAPNFITPRFNLSQLNLQFGKIKQAQNTLEQLHKINSNDIDIISSLGTLFMLQGNYHKSISYYKTINKKFLRRTDVALHYSISLFEIGQYKKAFDILSIANRSKSQYINLSRSKLQKMINKKILKNNIKKKVVNNLQKKRG